MVKLSRLIRANFAFFLILLFALIIRLYVFDYPLVAEETNRDFLIARHIAKYHEFVSMGPKNGTLVPLGNSPAYYYFLAVQFAIFDNVLFVSFLNVAMQLLSIVLLYILTKWAFGLRTAIISSLLISFSGISITASVWPWQPYGMYFILVCSYFFLYLGYKTQRFIYVTFAILFFAGSVSLHLSALGVAPAFLLTTLVIMKAQSVPFKFRLLSVFFILLMVVVPFLPRIFSEQGRNFEFIASLEQILPNSAKSIGFYFLDRVYILFKNIPAISFAALLFPYFYLKKSKNGRVKKIYLLLLLSISSFLITFSLIDGHFRDQHLYPVFPLLSIIAAENIRNISLKWKPVWTYLLVAILLIISFHGALDKSRGFLFTRADSANKISDMLVQEIKRVKLTQNKQDYNFFDLIIYSPPETEWFEGNRNIINSIYWLMLEKKMLTKLVAVFDGEFEAEYKNIGTKDYIFLNCLNYFQYDADCLERFSVEIPGYVIEKNIGAPIYGNSFYLARSIEQ